MAKALAREVLGLHFLCPEIQPVRLFCFSRLAPWWNQAYPPLDTRTALLTSGAQVCSEAKWPCGNVGRDSPEESLLGGLEWFLGLSAEQGIH